LAFHIGRPTSGSGKYPSGNRTIAFAMFLPFNFDLWYLAVSLALTKGELNGIIYFLHYRVHHSSSG